MALKMGRHMPLYVSGSKEESLAKQCVYEGP